MKYNLRANLHTIYEKQYNIHIVGIRNRSIFLTRRFSSSVFSINALLVSFILRSIIAMSSTISIPVFSSSGYAAILTFRVNIVESKVCGLSVKKAIRGQMLILYIRQSCMLALLHANILRSTVTPRDTTKEISPEDRLSPRGDKCVLGYISPHLSGHVFQCWDLQRDDRMRFGMLGASSEARMDVGKSLVSPKRCIFDAKKCTRTNRIW
jgi:hypothetical protein